MKTFRPRGTLAAAAMLSAAAWPDAAPAPERHQCQLGRRHAGQPGLERRRDEPEPGPRQLAGRAAGPGHQAGEPVRPADVAQPVPRQGRHAVVRGFRVHDGLPADHRRACCEAKQMLGAAGNQVQLLGVDANPTATSVADVLAYSRAHGMVNQWDFLTGSPAQLKAVWNAYNIAVQIEQGQIDHTPALFVIDQQRPGAEALPDPDGLLQRRPVRAGTRRRAVQPAARSPARGQPGVAGLHHRAGPHGSRRPAVGYHGRQGRAGTGRRRTW